MADTANLAKARLHIIVAADRLRFSINRMTMRNRQTLFLSEYIKPLTLMDKFIAVEPITRNTGQVIKWRKMTPFNLKE